MPDSKSEGTQTFQEMIRFGRPSVEAGLFVVYTDPINPHSNPQYMSRSLMIYAYGKWSLYDSAIPYTGPIHGWIGPIPSLFIQEKKPCPINFSSSKFTTKTV